MIIRQYLQELALVNPSLTNGERLALLEPIKRNGAITERLKDWLDAHGISAVINVSNRSDIDALAWYWHREAHGTEEENRVMDYWMRVNGIDILLMEQERLFEEYLNKQTLQPKYRKECVNAASAGGSLTKKLQEKHLLFTGESLLMAKTETVQKVADGLANGELNDLRSDLKSMLNHFLRWKGVTEHTVVARERVTETGVSVPSHGVRFLRVLQLYRLGLDQSALDAYDHLIKALSNGTFRYKGEPRASIHMEHRSEFKSFHKCALAEWQNNPNGVKTKFLENITGEQLQKVCLKTAERLFGDHGEKWPNVLQYMSDHAIAYENTIAAAAEELYVKAMEEEPNADTLAEAYLKLVCRVLNDCYEENPDVNPGIPAGATLRDPAFWKGNLLSDWLRSTRPDETTMALLTDIPVPDDNEAFDCLLATVFHASLYYADACMGREEEDCGKVLWLPIEPEATRENAEKAYDYLHTALNDLNRCPTQCKRALSGCKSEWYKPVRDSMLLGKPQCELSVVLLLRMAALHQMQASCPEENPEKKGVHLMIAKKYLHECETILHHRRTDNQISAEIAENMRDTRHTMVCMPLLLWVYLQMAEAEYTLSLVEDNEIWTEDIVELYITPAHRYMSNAKVLMDTIEAGETKKYIDPAVFASLEKVWQDQCGKYTLTFFDADNAIPSRMKLFNEDGKQKYREEYKSWREAFPSPSETVQRFPTFRRRTDDEAVESADTFEAVYMSTLDSVAGKSDNHQENMELSLFRQIANGKTILLQFNQIVDNKAMHHLMYVPGFRWLCRRGIIALSCYGEVSSPRTYLMNNLRNPGFLFSSSKWYALDEATEAFLKNLPSTCRGQMLTCLQNNHFDPSLFAPEQRTEMKYQFEAYQKQFYSTCRGQMLTCLENNHFTPSLFALEQREEMEFLFDAYLMMFECFQPSDIRRFHQNPKYRWPYTSSLGCAVPLNEVLAQRVSLISQKPTTRQELREALSHYTTRWGTNNKRSDYDTLIDIEMEKAKSQEEKDLLEKFRKVVYQAYFISNGRRSSDAVLLTDDDPELVVPETGILMDSRSSTSVKLVLDTVSYSSEHPNANWTDLGEVAMECRRIEQSFANATKEIIAKKKHEYTGFDYTVKKDEVIVQEITPSTSQHICKTIRLAGEGDSPTETTELIK